MSNAKAKAFAVPKFGARGNQNNTGMSQGAFDALRTGL